MNSTNSRTLVCQNATQREIQRHEIAVVGNVTHCGGNIAYKFLYNS